MLLSEIKLRLFILFNQFLISAILKINGQDATKLELEGNYFLWNKPTVNQRYQYEIGQKGAIIEILQ